jgi:hypothetical protein
MDRICSTRGRSKNRLQNFVRKTLDKRSLGRMKHMEEEEEEEIIITKTTKKNLREMAC